jgi:hypothetical protein
MAAEVRRIFGLRVDFPGNGTSESFTDANQHEYCRPLLWPKGRVALVYKADRASGIERVGIENLLILLATRAAGRLITGPCDNLDRRSVGAGSGTKESGSTGRTSGAGRTSRARRTSRASRPGLTLGWRLALPARSQEKGSDQQNGNKYLHVN